MINYKVGAYLRISQSSDNIDNNESNSIVNQRKLIRKYLKDKKDLKDIKFYIDDGYTGTNFDRPSFKKLYKDIYNKRINVIIVKDLSRLGRNYLQLGKYLEEFANLKIRLISISDNIDTNVDDKNNRFLIPIKNILNDTYTKDISMKIKTSLNIKKKQGEFVGAFACYGYKKDENDKHKLVIDDEASNVVKKIFELASENYSFSYIAKKLNEDKVLSPFQYKKEVLHSKISSRWQDVNTLWNQATVSRILQNEMYCGTLIQKSNNEIIKIKNAHIAIISEEDFFSIQKKYFKRKAYPDKTGKVSLFSGFLKCTECKKAMVKFPLKDNYIYYCSTYRKSKRKQCKPISIKNDYLERKVLEEVNSRILKVEKLKVKLQEVFNNIDNWQEVLSKEKTKSLENELNIKISIKNELLNDYENKVISRYDYLFFLNEFSKEIDDLKEKISEVDDNYFNWIDLFLKYKDSQVVTRELLNDLISDIYVKEKDTLDVVFKYDDSFSELINFF